MGIVIEGNPRLICDNEAVNMVTERSICLDGKTCTAAISDEPEALLAAKAAREGRCWRWRARGQASGS